MGPRVSYRIAVDIGGTFTDCVVVEADGGRRQVAKSLTTPGALDDGVLDAVALAATALGVTARELLSDTEYFVHGTTQATNALLTRTGSRTGLITTRGHEDSIFIGKVYAKVAGLAERDIVHASRLSMPEPIIPRALVRGVTERMDRDGDVVVALDEDEVATAIRELIDARVDAIAVSLLWSFANSEHERRIREMIALQDASMFCALSHEVAPVLGEYERTATTAVSAYIGPRVTAYLERLDARLREEGLSQPILIMQASGGLTSVADAARRAIVTLDSGPTGGVLGCRYLGALAGEPNIICTDVGGTSFDVGLILDGEMPLDMEFVVARYSLRMPKILVQSIGAGGGSIVWIDEGELVRVGPQSAGSNPGPACYGLGGTQATVTDADLVLGYLDEQSFLGGRMRLDRDRALRALDEIGRRVGLEPEELAAGVFRIINAQMADLVRRCTIEQGHDPRDCVLVAYGGAGPTHAAFYGYSIRAKKILIPADSTAFSAEGMLTCDITRTEEVSHVLSSPFDEAHAAAVGARFDELEARILAGFERDGFDRDEVALMRTVGVRFGHQVHTVDAELDPGPVRTGSLDRLVERFVDRYRRIYGAASVLSGGGVEFDVHRVTGRYAIEPVAFAARELAESDPRAALVDTRRAFFEALGFMDAGVFDGSRLEAGNVVAGPAIIQRMGDSVVIPPGYRAEVDRHATLHLHLIERPADARSETITSAVQ